MRTLDDGADFDRSKKRRALFGFLDFGAPIGGHGFTTHEPLANCGAACVAQRVRGAQCREEAEVGAVALLKLPLITRETAETMGSDSGDPLRSSGLANVCLSRWDRRRTKPGNSIPDGSGAEPTGVDMSFTSEARDVLRTSFWIRTKLLASDGRGD